MGAYVGPIQHDPAMCRPGICPGPRGCWCARCERGQHPGRSVQTPHLNPHPEGKAWTALCPGCIEELRRQQEQAGQMSFDDLSSMAGRQHSARNTVQPGLRVGGYLSIQQRFEEWLETDAGRIVYREFIRRARALVLTGWRHYSHKAIVESIRYDVNVRIGPNDGGFKINDHYSSRIVRRAMAQYPELDGFFEVRELRA